MRSIRLGKISTVHAFLWLLSIAIVGTAIASPPASSAAPANVRGVSPSHAWGAELRVRGTHAYLAEIEITNRLAALTVHRGHTVVRYTSSKSTADGREFQAWFAKLGEISLEFHPRSWRKVVRFPGGIRRSQSALIGSFTGSIHFEGEEGFTRIATRRATGIVFKHAKHPKRKPPEGSADKRKTPVRGYRLEVGSFLRGLLFFKAGPGAFSPLRIYQSRFGLPLRLGKIVNRGVAFSARLVQEGEPVTIERIVAASGTPASFAVEADKATGAKARVAPPAPFEGVGYYEECRRLGLPWYGDLSVKFPGVKATRLAGYSVFPSFKPGIGCTG